MNHSNSKMFSPNEQIKSEDEAYIPFTAFNQNGKSKKNSKSQKNSNYSSTIKNGNLFNSFENEKQKEREDFSDEDIIKDLLGISEDLDKSLKKADKKPYRIGTEKNNEGIIPAPFIIPPAVNLDIPAPELEAISFPEDLPIGSLTENNKQKEAIKNISSESKKGININTNKPGSSTINFNKSENKFNKLFENIIKEEEKSNEEKVKNLNKKQEQNINSESKPMIFMPYNFPTQEAKFNPNVNNNLNSDFSKLDKEIKKIPLSLTQFVNENQKSYKKAKGKV